MKLGLLFPGQGSQYIGMGKDAYDKYDEARKTFDQANDILGFDLKSVIFSGPEETLRQTQYTQPAIFTASVALFKAFNLKFEISNHSVVTAGHSLGEYSALCASGFFDFETGLKLVKARGEFIQAAAIKNPGAMAAIIGLDKSILGDICQKASSLGACQMVNFNSPGQIVIAGGTEAVNKAVELSNEAKAMKTVLLNVSGPFHSSLMTEASNLMSAELDKYTFSKPLFAAVTNCDAQTISDPSLIKARLTRQINSPVLWEDSIALMIKSGTEAFIEIGPGRVLSGLMRRIDKTKKVFNIEDSASLDKTLAALNQ